MLPPASFRHTAGRCFLLALVALAPVCQCLAAGQPPQIRIPLSSCLQPLGADCVADWGEMVVEALGVSARTESPPALTAALEARRDALRNLVAAISALRVNSSSTVGDLAQAHAAVRQEIADLARQGEIVSEWRDPSGHIEAIACAPIWNAEQCVGSIVARALAPKEAAEGRRGSTSSAAAPARRLVIDARGLDVVPALFPRISDALGRALFWRVPALCLSGNPFFVYARSVPQPAPEEELFVVGALRALGSPPCDIVIPSEPLRAWEEAGIAAEVDSFAQIVIVY